MTGRSIRRARIRTRVTTRSAGALGDAGGGAEPRGGRLIKVDGDGSRLASGEALPPAEGPASTGFVYVNRPAARNVTPSAVRIAGKARVRRRSTTADMAPEC